MVANARPRPWNSRRSRADMNQRLPPLVVFASLVAVAPSQGGQPDFRLQLVPAHVYKVDDPGGTGTSSFVFNLAVICETDCQLTPLSARVELSSAGSLVERQDWTTTMLARIKRVSYRVEPNTPPASPTRAFALPEAFDLRFYYRHPDRKSTRLNSSHLGISYAV